MRRKPKNYDVELDLDVILEDEVSRAIVAMAESLERIADAVEKIAGERWTTVKEPSDA